VAIVALSHFLQPISLTLKHTLCCLYLLPSRSVRKRDPQISTNHSFSCLVSGIWYEWENVHLHNISIKVIIMCMFVAVADMILWYDLANWERKWKLKAMVHGGHTHNYLDATQTLVPYIYLDFVLALWHTLFPILVRKSCSAVWCKHCSQTTSWHKEKKDILAAISAWILSLVYTCILLILAKLSLSLPPPRWLQCPKWENLIPLNTTSSTILHISCLLFDLLLNAFHFLDVPVRCCYCYDCAKHYQKCFYCKHSYFLLLLHLS